MVTPPIEMAGQRFGRLVVLERAGKDRWGRSIWLCECDCGTRKPITQHNLRQGFTISCGCYRRDYHSKHGRAGDSLYGRWQALRARCRNPNDKRYADYGGRGIYCAEEWDDFTAFARWADENGFKPELQIDRIDNDGPYAPWNCRWVDAKTNMANRRNSRKATA